MKQQDPANNRHQARQIYGSGIAFLLCATINMAKAQQTELPNRPGLVAAPSASLVDAQRVVEQGQFDQAEAILRSYLQRNPKFSDAAYLLAYSLLREGKAREALTAYTQAATLRTPTAEDLRNVAQAYVVLDDYTEAGRWLARSLRMQPNSPDTWYNLGRLRYTQNLFAEAVECFEKVLVLVPRSVKAENNLGLAYEGLNRTHDAELAYRQALAWQDTGPRAAASEQPLLNLAIILLHNADPSEAQDLLLRAVLIAPKDARIHEQLGQLYLRAAKSNEAVREFEVATELAPDRSSLHFLLGQAYKHAGRQSQAAAQFAEAAHLSRTPQDQAK